MEQARKQNQAEAAGSLPRQENAHRDKCAVPVRAK